MTGAAIDDALVDAVCRRAADVRGEVSSVVAAEVDALAPLAGPHERALAISRCIARLTGLDALEEHLTDPAVDEVMVNAGREVWVDRDGELQLVDRIGYIEDALGRAAELANVSLDSVRCVEYRQPPSPLGTLLGSAKDVPARQVHIDMNSLVDMATPRAYYLCTWLPAVVSTSR